MRRLLFVCVENSCRSQMAEAFARLHGGPEVEAFSAGSRPSGVVHPRAVAAMREVGCDLSTHRSSSIDALPEEPFDAVVTMGCGETCPFVAARSRFDWNIPDPKDMDPTGFRKVRDRIEQEVLGLLAGIA